MLFQNVNKIARFKKKSSFTVMRSGPKRTVTVSPLVPDFLKAK